MTANQLSVFPPEPIRTASPIHQNTPADQPVLPNGWQWVKLSDGVTLSSEKYQPKGETEYYVGLEHIEKGTGRISERAQVEPISTVKNSFRAGEILYGKLRPYLNKVALAVCDGVCSTDILVLRPKETVAARYVHYFMLRDKFVNDMSANSMGVNLPRVPTKYVLGYSFPLPALAEQLRIVAKIEELFSEIYAGIQEVETALKRLKTYRQAVLHHYVNNPDWEQVRLGSVIKSIDYGTSKKCHSEIIATPVLRIPNINEDGTIDTSSLKYAEFEDSESKHLALREGDLLTIRSNGSVSLVGHVGYVPQNLEGYLFAGYLIRLRFNRSECNSKFISYSLRSPALREQIESKAKSTSGVNNINSKEIQALLIALPELATQIRAVQEIEARLSEADALEKTLRTELLRAERLRQSVLKQAFTGKLLKTDVPASLPA